MILAAGSSVSLADGCPPGCSQNRFNVDIGADKFEIVSGDTVNYTVTAFNNVSFSDGCDAGVSSCGNFGHGVVVQFCCPQPNGTPNPFNDFAPGHCTELSAPSVGDNFPAAAKPTVVYPPVACVVTVDPGVGTANGIVGAGDVANSGTPNANKGTIHFPAGDRGFQATKPIPVTIDFCGDGIINQSCETCDTNTFPDNAPATHGACRTGECGSPGCTFCGDGIVNGGEQCDDGDGNDNDECRNNCVIPVCGDGIVDAQNGETCDPPSSPAGGNGNTCRDNCTVCGDGVVNSGETCDDGNGVDNDNCRNNCTIPVCGDGIVDAGEQCDDGNSNNNDGCRNDCTPPGGFCPNSNPLLGAGRACTVLESDAFKVSITGPAGQIQGDICLGAGGSLALSGSNFILGDVHFENVIHCDGCSTGPTGRVRGADGVSGTVDVDAALVGGAIDDCEDAASVNAAKACTVGNYTKSLSELALPTADPKVRGLVGLPGENVVCVSKVEIGGGETIQLKGDAPTTFVINVVAGGNFKINGGEIKAVSPVDPNDVLYNVLGTGGKVAFTGGGGGPGCCKAEIDGTLVAIEREVALSPGLINGQLCSDRKIDIVSGSGVHCPLP